MDNNNNETALAPTDTTPPIIQTKDGKLFRHINVDGFNGFAEYRVPPPSYPTGEPYIDWVGPKFSLDTWHSILAFFEWSYRAHKSEAQVRLYVNLRTRETKAWAFPQRCVGMTTQELGDHVDWVENEAMVRGFDKVGTVHHHCSGSAFQSGTDRGDESKSNGLHITVGHIGSSTYDLHTRVILNGNSREADLTQWFEMPPELEQLPALIAPFRDSIFLGLLRRQPPDTTPFPEVWKDNVKTYHTSPYGHTWSPGTTNNNGHPANCACIACGPDWRTRRNPSQSASSTATPGPGAGAKSEKVKSEEVRARVAKALKKITVESPNALEEAFLKEIVDAIQVYRLTPARALELVCLLIVGDSPAYTEWQEDLLAEQWEKDLSAEQQEEAKAATRAAYGEEAADHLYGLE